MNKHNEKFENILHIRYSSDNLIKTGDNTVRIYGSNSDGFVENLLKKTEKGYELLEDIFIPKNPSERFDYVTEVRFLNNKVYVYGFNNECMLENVLKKTKKGYKILHDGFIPINKEEFNRLVKETTPYHISEMFKHQTLSFIGIGIPKESQLEVVEGWLPFYSAASRI